MSTYTVNPSASATSSQSLDPSKSLLCAVLDDGRIALVRVIGRGNFCNSVPFKNFSLKMQESAGTRMIIDLQYCESMDSTFMGVLAGMCLTQMKSNAGRISVVNANEHCRRLLKNLGIIHLLDLRTGDVAEVQRAEDEDKFAPAKCPQGSRVEQICTMLEAHRELVRLDQKNEVQFQAVIEYLEKSLQEERDSKAPH
ncbi:STAS domain-containing protein [Candidatus Sumerlaeota bacterium]|nr:STAS domain-containing protein [Candidatus Sumerlaeota bacterium]